MGSEWCALCDLACGCCCRRGCWSLVERSTAASCARELRPRQWLPDGPRDLSRGSPSRIACGAFVECRGQRTLRRAADSNFNELATTRFVREGSATAWSRTPASHLFDFG